jgi:hypothetical protein
MTGKNDQIARNMVGTRFYRVRDLSIWATIQLIADAVEPGPYGDGCISGNR